MLTGRTIRFGNFSILPWTHLDSLVAYPELWNHYAATLLKSRLPYASIRCNRGTRIAGRSRMDFTSLVVHGMSALFADQEVVGTRLLMATIGLTTILLSMIGLVIGVKLFTTLAIPGWATFTLGLLLDPGEPVGLCNLYGSVFRNHEPEPTGILACPGLPVFRAKRNQLVLKILNGALDEFDDRSALHRTGTAHLCTCG